MNSAFGLINMTGYVQFKGLHRVIVFVSGYYMYLIFNILDLLLDLILGPHYRDLILET